MPLGCIVDSYTNILTVKLFAHAEREDAYARAAIEEQTAKHRHYVRLTTLMTALLFSLNGLANRLHHRARPVALEPAEHHARCDRAGDGLVVRISQMSGWAPGNLVTSIFRMWASCRRAWRPSPNRTTSSPQARDLIVTRGEINFDAIGFNYGSIKGLPVPTQHASSTGSRSPSARAKRWD